jgi:hypothetical protein
MSEEISPGPVEGNRRLDFDAFLSHNSNDKSEARQLKQLLESRGLTVWFDEDQLQPGLSWQPLLEQGLQIAGSVIVAIGSAGMGPWQTEETRAAISNAQSLNRPVIPVLLPNSASAEPALGAFLRARTWVDLRGGYSSLQINRLVWGITGRKVETGRDPSPKETRASTKWILVAGSGGSTAVPTNIEVVSRSLGDALATAGFSLVTGGWNGVDGYVARAFAERIQQSGQSLAGRLVQVMQEGARPHFPSGRLVSGGSEDDAWIRSVQRADAVVLVGGLGGTYRTGQIAQQLGKFVFPLADTRSADGYHSDAFNFYYSLLQDWKNNSLSSLLSQDEFLSIADPAPGVISNLVKLLGLTLVERSPSG